MTEHQRKLLTFLRARIAETGVCPSYAEMQRHMGQSSKSGPHRLVDVLVREGYVVRSRSGGNRTLKLAGSNLHNEPTAALIAELERRGVRLG